MAEATAAIAAPTEEPAIPLVTYLDGLMVGLRTGVPMALTHFGPDAIHQSRVATRRMKAALDLMDGVLSGRPRRALARVMRRLRRRLGPLRDADVMLEHVNELTSGGKFLLAGPWLVQHLNAE